MSNDEIVDDLVSFYGDSSIVPSRAQWHSLIGEDNDGPLCMVNFMKFRETADYAGGESVSGIEAMMRYQEVAQKIVSAVGGEFVVTGLFGGIMIGAEEDWDAIGVVRYPNKEAFIQVFRDTEYRNNHFNRMAGTLRHRMAIVFE